MLSSIDLASHQAEGSELVSDSLDDQSSESCLSSAALNDGSNYKVPKAVTSAIHSFQVPPELAEEGYNVLSPRSSNAITWYYGVVLKKAGSADTI